MKLSLPAMNTCFFFAVGIALTLGALYPAQAQTSRSEADMQRRHMREYLRHQRHYQQQLQKFQEDLLAGKEDLQLHYSESVISEQIYLEASGAYEKLLERKLAVLPNTKIAQDAVLKAQKDLRQAGKSPQYYQAQLRNLQTARIHFANLRDSIKDEDDEVKLVFEEMSSLERKYLAASRTYGDLMAKALAKHPEAKATQQKLDEVNAKIRRARAQPKR